MMPYHRTALSLLLLQYSSSTTTTAFQATSFSNRQQKRRYIDITTSSSSSSRRTFPSSKLYTASINNNKAEEETTLIESILDDGHGHINSNLAQAIYEWEVAQKFIVGHQATAAGGQEDLFSTRDGLRLVDQSAREILSSLSDEDEKSSVNDGSNRKVAGISYNDLVQEGIMSLLRAMSTYDNYTSTTTDKKILNFEEYAKQSITSSYLHYINDNSSTQLRLPYNLSSTLQAANTAATKLRNTLGKEPTLIQVANEVNVKPEQLALYRKLYRSMGMAGGGGARSSKNNDSAFVSVEDGMEIYDPTLAGVGGVGESGSGIRSRKDLNVDSSSSSSSSGSGRGDDDTKVGESESITTSSATTASLTASSTPDKPSDSLSKLNSQEDDWTRDPPERSVAPLRDVLTDTEEINNPLEYTHHYLLNEELNDFLKETLTEEELTIIQLRFGLVDSKYGGKGWTANDIGKRMGMDHDDVVKVAGVALDKLRNAVKESSEDDVDFFVEVSL